MERSSSVVVLACLVLVVSGGAVPGIEGSTDSPQRTVAGGVVASSSGGVAASSSGSVVASSTGWVDTTATEGPLERHATVSARPPTPGDNTTARLTLAHFRVTRSEFDTVRIGLGSTLQSGRDGARLANDRIRIEREFDAAGSVKEKRNTIDNALIDLEDETKELQARERRALRHYSDGNITGQTLVRRLARIDARARNLRQTVQLLRALSDRTGASVRDDFEPRFSDVEGPLKTLQGPVRHRATEVLAGETSPTRIHVTSSDEGVVMAMMAGDHYVREAKDWRKRNASGERELESTSEALERADELYPWVVSQRGRTSVDWTGLGIWQWDATHPQGELVAYIDDSTRDVFRETQTVRVDDVPASTTVVDTSGDLRVTLERTYVGGPLRIYVENAATSAAVNARVLVDGYDLGNAGTDGHLRTIEPRTPYNVTVSDGNETYTFTVERPFAEGED